MRAGTGWRRMSGLLLATALVCAWESAGARAEDLDQLKREAAALVESLKHELEAVRKERAELRREREALEAERAAKPAAVPPETPAPGAVAPPVASAAAQQETDRKVGVLAEEFEKLKSAIVLPESKELKSYYGLGPGASKVYQISRGLSIGGYGETNLSKKVQHTQGQEDRADALRFVLYTGYKFSDRILLNAELEVEHATTEETVSSDAGEVALEFAYLDFLGWEELNARAGLVLMPLGFINEQHEPVYFYGVHRPQVERVIIPTTWRELGVGVFGSFLGGDVQYRTYGSTSLNAEGFEPSGIREGRQSGDRALAESYGWSGRLDWVPHQVPGLLIGGSAFVGATGQNQDFAGQDATALLDVWDLHAQYRWRGLQLRALAAFSHLGDADLVSRELEETIGDRAYGNYFEIAYDVMPHLFPDLTRQSVAPFFRYEHYDPQAGVPTGFPRDENEETELYTVGLSYKPHPQVVLKLDYRNFKTRDDGTPDDVNVGLGFVF